MEATPRAKEYHRRKMALGVLGFAIEIAFLVVLVFTGLSTTLASAARAIPGGVFADLAIFVLLFLILGEVLSLPVSIVKGHVLERRYGLSKQTLGGWFADHLKALILNAILTLLLVEILYAFLYFGGRWWWVWTGAVFSGLFVVLARLAPVLIFPLFFKFSPLEQNELRERLERLAEKARANVTGIFEMNLSRKSNTVNAALAGIGKSRRIILADTLLQRFTSDEIEVVVAHEFGHHLHRHLPKGIILQTGATFLFLFMVDRLGSRWATELGYGGLTDIAALPLLALTAAVMGLLVTPLLNTLLRHFERQADQCAIELTQLPQAFDSTMRRLASLNMADPSPHPLIEWFFYSHPSIKRRLEFGQRYMGQV